MNWNELLDRHEVQALRTSRAEIDRFRDAVERDLRDATVTGLSIDRRYAVLYNAALQLASMLVRCSGYRVTSREGHHALTFDVLTLILGKSAEEDVMYFQACRAKRHLINYGTTCVVSSAECDELKEEVHRFRERVEGWISQNHSDFAHDSSSPV